MHVESSQHRLSIMKAINWLRPVSIFLMRELALKRAVLIFVLNLTETLGISICINVRFSETTRIRSSWIIKRLGGICHFLDKTLLLQADLSARKWNNIERIAYNDKRHQSCSSISGWTNLSVTESVLTLQSWVKLNRCQVKALHNQVVPEARCKARACKERKHVS